MSLAPDTLPRIAITIGDPAGIGPEIVATALAEAELARELCLVVLGPLVLKPDDLPLYGEQQPDGHAWRATDGPQTWDLGRVQPACGRAALEALRAGAELAQAGRVCALVTAPVSKEALHLAGEAVEGQTELLVRWSGASPCQMLAVAEPLRVMLLSRHLPLREAIQSLDGESIVEHLLLLDETLRALGLAQRPRLALAGLNPHAGEHGLLGSEEIDILEPAVRMARTRGLDVSGPRSPDSVFLEALNGRWDGVLALYHDQAFVPLKLCAGDRGLTLIAGLPYLRLSPVHGTAFEIAGSGRASAANLLSVLRQAAAWGPSWKCARTGS